MVLPQDRRGKREPQYSARKTKTYTTGKKSAERQKERTTIPMVTTEQITTAEGPVVQERNRLQRMENAGGVVISGEKGYTGIVLYGSTNGTREGKTMYRIQTEVFMLEIAPEAFRLDSLFPADVTLDVKVSSYGFQGESRWELDFWNMVHFVTRLKSLYETLKGSAKLEEDSLVQDYIEFIAQRDGHIRITGRIHSKDGSGYTQEITFENEFDQTFLTEFVTRLLAGFGKWIR